MGGALQGTQPNLRREGEEQRQQCDLLVVDYLYQVDRDVEDTASLEEVELSDWDGVYASRFPWHAEWFDSTGVCDFGLAITAIIVNEYFGAKIATATYLAHVAINAGIVNPPINGLLVEDALAIVESQEVPVESGPSNVDDLATRLEAGFGVICAVNRSMIRGKNNENEDDQKIRALVINRINVYDNTVILCDPGTPDVPDVVVSIDQFHHAWAESGNYLLSTVLAGPDTSHDGYHTDLAGRADYNSLGRQISFLSLAGSRI